MRAGLRRLLAIVLAVSGATAVAALLAGLAVGADLFRAVATGFYLVGSLALISGVAVGMRGPTRPAGRSEPEPGFSLFGVSVATRGARRATPHERREANSLAWLLLGLGTMLIVVGVVADTGAELV